MAFRNGAFLVAIGLATSAAWSPSACFAQNPAVSWVDLYQGSALSDLAKFLSVGGYELSDGTWVSFGKWYSTGIPEIHADFLLQLADDYGLLWGFGTGEAGEKYRIDPSVKLGFIAQAHPRPNATISLTATSTLWGSFTEYPCVADYGDGSPVEVNCRLAAGILPPATTLNYLMKSDPSRLALDVSYRVAF